MTDDGTTEITVEVGQTLNERIENWGEERGKTAGEMALMLMVSGVNYWPPCRGD